MRIKFENGKYLELYPNTRIDFEFNSPIFEEVGSHTGSFSIPRSYSNNLLLSVFDALNTNISKQYTVYVELKRNSFESELNILEASASEFKVFVSFHTGHMNKKMKDLTLQDMSLGGSHPTYGNDEFFHYYNSFNIQSSPFAVFPVYMPDFYNGSESEELKPLVFTDDAGTPLDPADDTLKPLTLGDYHSRINKGVVNKIWKDHIIGSWRKMYWHWTQWEAGTLREYHLGTVVPFPFLKYIVNKIFEELGYVVTDSIFNKYKELMRIVIFNNFAMHTEDFEMGPNYHFKNHVPVMKLTDFFASIKDYLGLYFIPSLYGNNLIITNFKEIVNSVEVIDITDISDVSTRITPMANGKIKFKIGFSHDSRPNEYINGFYRLNPTAPSSPYENEDTGLIVGTGNDLYIWVTDEYGNKTVEPLRQDQIDLLNTVNAVNINTPVHTLEQTLVAYYWDDDLFEDTNYRVIVKMPQASNITGCHAFNNRENKLDRLILLYYYKAFYSGSYFYGGEHYGTSYPKGPNAGEEFGSNSLHLDRDGICQKWQNEYLDWMQNRRKLVTKQINWGEPHLTDSFFIQKYRIDNTNYIVKKVKGQFLPNGEIEFGDTELFVL